MHTIIDNELLQKTLNIVRQAGNFIWKEYTQFAQKHIIYKSKFDLVSYVDIETEKMLIHQLQNISQEAGVIAEETHHHSQKEWNWIIDPLDGTTNFTRHLPLYAISVALAYQNDVQLGVVFNIPTNEMFYAVKGQGAFLNGEIIKVSTQPDIATSLIATGFSVSKFDKLDAQMKIIKEIITHSLGIRRMGTAAVDLCYVACGRFDAFFEWYLNPWDVAAGALIAQEAGAMLSDFSQQNNFLFGKEIIAAQPKIYHTLIHIIQKNL